MHLHFLASLLIAFALCLVLILLLALALHLARAWQHRRRTKRRTAVVIPLQRVALGLLVPFLACALGRPVLAGPPPAMAGPSALPAAAAADAPVLLAVAPPAAPDLISKVNLVDAKLHELQATLGVPAGGVPPSFWESTGGKVVIYVFTGLGVAAAVASTGVQIAVELRR